MDFNCFQPHMGNSDSLLDFHIQQSLPDLHSTPDFLKATTAGCTSALGGMPPLQIVPQSFHISGSSSVPLGSIYELAIKQKASNNAAVMTNHTSMVHKAGMPSLTPNIDAPHLAGSSNHACKPFQLSGKYNLKKKAACKAIKKANIIKGKWAAEEDRELIKLLGQFGFSNWSHIAQMLPGRMGKQCRERWCNHLRPNIKKDAWSEEEDKILIQAHKEIGNKWSEIAKQLPGRTENSTKNHWNATKRKKFARRSRMSKNHKTQTLLQDYIKTCGPAIRRAKACQAPQSPTLPPTPQVPALPPSSTPQVSQLRAKDQKMKLELSGILAVEDILDMCNDTYSQTHYCEDELLPIIDDFSIDMCDVFRNTKVELKH